MRPPTDVQKERMATAAESSMWDTCILVIATPGGEDAYGNPAILWVESSVETPCGLDLRNSFEVLKTTQVWLYDALLRLPIGTVVHAADRLRVTKRHGTVLAPPLTFEIIGEPRLGMTGLVVQLKTLADGSL